MTQIKIYGFRAAMDPVKDELSDVVHSCVMDALAYPADKRAHRFFGLEPGDFRFPPGRSDRHTIIEISMFEGRSVAAKKKLFRLLFERIEQRLSIAPMDIEVTITETPMHNGGIRGVPADELSLDYQMEV